MIFNGGRTMNYKCHDIFMIRTPDLPIDIFNEFDSYQGDSISFLQENEEVNRRIREGLLVSSQSIFKSLENIPTKKKKIKNLDIGIKKYLIRMATRPTPYGLFAGVGLGEFGTSTSLKVCSKRHIKDVKADTHWLFHVIYKIESDITLLSDLNLKWNDICYQWGNRIKNPYFSNHGDINNEDIIEESNIRYTNLLNIVRENTREFIPFSKLKMAILEQYEGVPEKLVGNTILDLVENEYLLTDLRLPAYCDDTLGYVIEKLKNVKNAKEQVETLEKIYTLMRDYKNNSTNNNTLIDIYREMKKIYTTSNYIEVNKGLVFDENKLSLKIKHDLEKFIDTMSLLYVKQGAYSELDKFKKEFSEEYGMNVRVPLVEVIDSNGFDGLSKIEKDEHTLTNRETIIKGIVDRKIIQALMKGEEEVKLNQKDFPEIIKEEKLNLPKSFDMNFFIVAEEKDDSYRYIIGPNCGSTKAGKMFQRFVNLFDKNLLNIYNQIYGEEIKLTQNDYELVEARETTVKGRVSNVINRYKNHNYYINISCEDGKLGKVTLEDLSIGLTSERELYIYSEKLKKKCKIISDNMLNPRLNSKILYFLKAISDEYEGSILSRKYALYENTYNYVPRISLDNVIISLKTWKFTKISLKCEDYSTFKKEFKKLRKIYDIDQYVYQCEGDNRLILNLDKEYALELLYSVLKKSNKIELSEIEPGLFTDLIVFDENNKKYVSEFTFSFIQKEQLQQKSEKTEVSCELLSNNRILELGHDGWIYMKIYGLGTRTNELLKKSISELLNKINVEKWFFIRYADPEEHIRLRLKFTNPSEAFLNLRKIIEWEKEQKAQGLFKKSIFDTYRREINRYGGMNLIPLAESVFCKDSAWVISALNQFNINEKEEEEKLYFVGILGVLKALTNGIDEIFQIIDIGDVRNRYREEYKPKRNQYINWVEDVLTDNLENIDHRFLNISGSYKNWQDELKEFRKELRKNAMHGRLSNTKEHIISSISHMYCNRLKGSMQDEKKYRIMLRHAIFDLIRKKKYQNNS